MWLCAIQILLSKLKSGKITNVLTSHLLYLRYEEYIDYIFPDEVALAPNLKILEAAYKWKKQKTDDTDDD
jgi:hypothetical protein